MARPMRSTDARPAAINASTVFAITLAIIAGLICAWVFKTVFLTPKKAAATPPPPTYRVTVLAANVTEDSKISSLQVKRITVDQKKYDEFQAKVKDKGEILTGNQPIGRVPIHALNAEEPVYINDVKPLHYPAPLKIEPGKVAAIVEVPSKYAMVRPGDHVDLLCTLSNTDPDLGPTETRTATMAKNVLVLARFNTTADAARPSRSMARTQTRPYTLEVTPYRYGLIELAKQIGGAFSLEVRSKQDTGLATSVSAKGSESEDPANVERVTTDDLVKLFGFARPLPPKYFEIEKFSGVDQVKDAHIYLQPGSPAPSTKSSSSSQSRPGASGGGLQGPNNRPGNRNTPPPGNDRPRRSKSTSGNRQASLGGGTLNADMGLVESEWRRVASTSGGSSPKSGNRAASKSGTTPPANADMGLADSSWRRVRTSGSGNPAMANNRRVGGVSGGGLGGPNSSMASLEAARAMGGCQTCGQKQR